MNTSFGETLRAAREAKGLTTSQIAAKTRMLVQIVEEMENEDFHRIAAPIYGRGFVKLYAECVGLDPLPLVKEFMDIYEGRRAPIVRTRDVPVQPSPASVPAPEPPPAPAPEPIPEPPPVVAPMPELAPEPISEPPPVVIPPPKPAPEPIPEPPSAAEPAPEPSPEPPPVVRGLELFESAPQPPPQAAPEPPPAPSAGQPPAANVADIFSGSPYLSTESTYGGEGPSAAERFKNSLSSVSHGVIQSVRDIPRSVWRITLLALASLVLLALLIWGCVKLYQATSITPTNQQQLGETPHEPKVEEIPQPVANPPVPGITSKASGKTPKKAGARPEATPPVSSAGKASAKPAAASAKRPPLRSTGQKVPALYAD